MYDLFLNLMKLIAPFTPFIAENIYQNLRTETMEESIHLSRYPMVNVSLIDEELEAGMEQIRSLVESGRALRSKIGIKVRYPLEQAILVCSKDIQHSIENLLDLLKEEINVKSVVFEESTAKYTEKEVKPKFSVIGPRFKQHAPIVSKHLQDNDLHRIYEILQKEGKYQFESDDETFTLEMNDFDTIEKEQSDIARTETSDIILLLKTTLTDELRAEGFAREIIRRIQSMRKELDLEVEQSIKTSITVNKDNQQMLENWMNSIKDETRSKTLVFKEKISEDLVKDWKIDEDKVSIGISKTS